MGSWSYCSLAALKAQLGDALSIDDSLYREKLEAASEEVDAICGRTFRVHLATLYARTRGGRLLPPGDLLGVTSLKSDEDGDRTYEVTWATTDYDLEPHDAASRRAPYWEILTTPDGAYSFPSGSRGVEIVGTWGYFEDLASAGTIAAAIADATTTSVTMTAGHGLEPLQTILVDSEQLYVTAVATNTLTVERGVNGTTAAGHLILAPVRRYRYPALVREATALIAEELLRPFGVTGRVDDTQQSIRVLTLPHRVGELLEDFRLARVA